MGRNPFLGGPTASELMVETLVSDAARAGKERMSEVLTRIVRENETLKSDYSELVTLAQPIFWYRVMGIKEAFHSYHAMRAIGKDVVVPKDWDVVDTENVGVQLHYTGRHPEYDSIGSLVVTAVDERHMQSQVISLKDRLDHDIWRVFGERLLEESRAQRSFVKVMSGLHNTMEAILADTRNAYDSFIAGRR